MRLNADRSSCVTDNLHQLWRKTCFGTTIHNLSVEPPHPQPPPQRGGDYLWGLRPHTPFWGLRPKPLKLWTVVLKLKLYCLSAYQSSYSCQAGRSCIWAG